MRQVRQLMGLPVSIEVPDAKLDESFEAAFDRLVEIDERFSTYKPKSEVSKFAAGKLNETELSPELREVIKQCREWEEKTGGYFSAWAGGIFEPSGFVKGWAIAEAGKAIEKAGYKTYCIGAGGDILARSNTAKVWKIGIQDPRDRSKILDLLSISNGAVATSGNYARGTHIVNPKTGKPAEFYASVTVAGPDIIFADALATAIFAAGETGGKLIKKFPAYQSITVL